MRFRDLPLRSLLHHWRLHLGILLGTAVAAVVLTGALLVGVSVDRSLRAMAGARLGPVTQALDAGPRFLDASVVDAIEGELGTAVVPLLKQPAVALRRGPDGQVAATMGVTLYGVDERFGGLAANEGPLLPAEAEVLVNGRVAAGLGATPGELLTLRIGRTAAMPLDAPLSTRGEGLTRLGSFTVAGIPTAAQRGELSLRNEQAPPANVFVDLAWLQHALGRPGASNLLLTTHPDADAVERAFTEAFEIGHAGYRLRRIREPGVVQLEAERVFLEPAVTEAAQALPGAVGSLTWLVDSLTGPDGASTPYSFAVALEPSAQPGSPVPEGMADNEIVLNAWTAEALGVFPGDAVVVASSMPDARGRYESRERSFTVREVLDMEAVAGERFAVPPFPGLTDVDRCGGWEVGMPLDRVALADPANEAYWDRWRQTPKAFVTLAAGRELWANRWGELTAVRFPIGSTEPPGLAAVQVVPKDLGFAFQPVAEQAERSVNSAIDFGGLFLGMSIFIIAAALALASMLAAFGIQQRRGELGTLAALGFSGRQVGIVLLAEGALATLAGAMVGALLGGLYTRAVLQGLHGSWSSAIAGTEIAYHGSASVVLVGAATTFLCSVLTLALTIHRQLQRELGELMAAGSASPGQGPRGGLRAGALALGMGLLAALATAAGSLVSWVEPSAAFFVAGASLLLAFLASLWCFLERSERPSPPSLSLVTLAWRNALRRRWRSVGAAGIFACGCFVVVAVSSMGTGLSLDTSSRWSGTGGFARYAEAVLPVPVDALEAGSGGVVPMRIRDGDDASCLNLERAQEPKLLGVDPGSLAARRAFESSEEGASVWELLRTELPPGVVPGLVGDQDTAQWNLGLKAGDELAYLDEQGELLRVRIVGTLPVRKSILQGTILVAEAVFTTSFPSQSGYRAFLMDDADASLEERFAALGLVVQTSEDRLRSF